MLAIVLRRLLVILVAADCLLLALITLGQCKRAETISASLWSLEQDGKWVGRILRPVVDLLFYPVDKDHCSNSWLNEKHRYE